MRVSSVELLAAKVANETLFVKDEALFGRQNPLLVVDLALAPEALVGVVGPES